ncbi:MAG: YceI family protein, partial [Chloroflexi bacterium]|nr:YceI family protein [Chloroflexota bacterium]
RFPTITYKSHRIERDGDGYRVAGDLTIRGITREVALGADFGGVATDPQGNVRAGFSAEVTINRKDFGLNWNAALEAGGFMVGDKVKITIEAEVVQKAMIELAA